MHIYAEMRDENGALVDPTTVRAQVHTPSGSEPEITVTREALGTFVAIYTPQQEGVYAYRWHCTDPTCVTEGYFFANGSSFTTPI